VIVLDTHAWLWWLSDPGQLSRAASAVIREAMAEDAVMLSAISVWELAMLVDRGRLELDRRVEDFAAQTEALPFVHLVDVDRRIAIDSVALDLEHRDPADRMIAATARHLRAPLITKDARLRAWGGVETVW
jgi:PIN domain nuclease of toxin-antitoxin system